MRGGGRLLDVCRVALVFDHAWELASYLEALCGDREVSVVHAKNRLHPAYDDTLSGGYRDVNLNLVLHSAEAVRLGLSRHVWELQLQLTPIARFRTVGGHQRYVQYRNARAQ